MDFKSKVSDPSRGLYLFGLVPPPAKKSGRELERVAREYTRRLSDLGVDGVNIYDVQNEDRNGEPRPYKFVKTVEPRMFSRLLKENSCMETIIYNSVVRMPRDEFRRWLDETMGHPYSETNFVFVGGDSADREYPGPTVNEAAYLATQKGAFVGGIMIPERHWEDERMDGNEHKRVREKTLNGVRFFTSQVVYNADNVIAFLRDYNELCEISGTEPARIVLTFAPFGRDGTVDFLRWLGAEIPKGTKKRVMSMDSEAERVKESIEICRENLARILDASDRRGFRVPLGITSESVSKYRSEIDGAVDLFGFLKEEMKQHYPETVRV
jgi:5,10-methylenetetrahydrofolate reductase